MKFIHLILTFLSSVSWIYFVFQNIENFRTGGVGTIFLFIFIILSFSNFILQIILDYQAIILKKILFLLLFFFVFFIFKILIDLRNNDEIQSFTFGTTKGIITAFLIGVCKTLNIQYLIRSFHSSKFYGNLIIIMVLLLFLFYGSQLYKTINIFLADLSEDVFLISDGKAKYQRPGILMVMSYTFLSVVFLASNYLCKPKINFFRKLILIALNVIYVMITFAIIVLSQLIGSNSAVLFVSMIFFPSFIFNLIGFINPVKLKSINNLNIKKIFGIKWSPILKKTLFAFGLFSIIVTVVIQQSNFDITKTRLFGFGKGENNSINSRVKIIQNNFITHISYNPIFGDFEVDRKTTGGYYVHSFIISIQTHLGLIGLLFISLILLFIWNSLKHSENVLVCNYVYDVYLNKLFRIYLLILLVIFFVFSSLTTFFTWMPIWMLFGLISSPIFIQESKNL
jgi:hypothetical protein